MVTAGHATALAFALARSTFGVEAAIAVLGLMGIAGPVVVAMAMRAGSARTVTPSPHATG